MNLKDFIKEKRNDEISEQIIEELNKVSDCDDDLIFSVLVYLKNDDDKKAFLDYLKEGIDVDYEQIILNALWLNQQRKNNTRSNNG